MKKYPIMFPICAYAAGIILMSVQTDDKKYYIYTTIIALAAVLFMAINILKLPYKVRLKNAFWEIGYCILLYSIIKLLAPVTGNIVSGILTIIICVIYITKINPLFMGRNLLEK